MNASPPPLSTHTSHGKGSAADQQSADPLSVDDLLDNPWHYDCVVSPRLQSSDIPAPSAKPPFPLLSRSSIFKRSTPPTTPYERPRLSPPFLGSSAHRPRPAAAHPPSKSSVGDRPPSPPPSCSPPRGRQPALSKSTTVGHPVPSLSTAAKLDRSLTAQASSNYVSLASFIHNADSSSYESSAEAGGMEIFSNRGIGKLIKPVPSKCRERKPNAQGHGDASRIRSYTGCVAVD